MKLLCHVGGEYTWGGGGVWAVNTLLRGNIDFCLIIHWGGGGGGSQGSRHYMEKILENVCSDVFSFCVKT